jgi:MFS family permease
VPGIGSDLGLGRNNLFLFWAMLFNEASFGFYQTLYPLYVESLGASPGVVGLVIGIAGLVRLAFLLPSGLLTDRVPLRWLIVVGRSCTVVGTLLFAAAQAWWQLLPAIALTAAGNVAFPAISKVIADSTTDANRTRAFTLIFTVGPSVALLASPVLGGLLAEHVSLRSIFIAAALSQAVAVSFFWRIRISEPHATRHVESSYHAALAHRPVLLLCGLQLAILLVLTTGFTLAPNYLEDEKGVSIGTIGQFGSLVAVCSVVLGVLIAKVRIFSRPLNALLLTTGLAPVAFALFLVGNATWVFALAFFCRGGYLVGWGLFYPALGDVTPEHLRGRAFALSEILGGLGFALAPFAAGALYEVSPPLPMLAALIGVAPLLLLIAVVRRFLYGNPAATSLQ